MKMYSTFLFDVGGTLIQFDYETLARACAERANSLGLGVTLPQTRAVLEALELEIPERVGARPLSLNRAEANRFWTEFWADGFRRLGVPAAPSRAFAQELLVDFGSHFESVFPDAPPTLQALRDRGARLGVVSNFSDNCETLLAELDLGRYFDFFIVSAVVGVEKPDPRIFELAIEAARRPRSEMVYIGDSPFHDVAGAQAAGLDAVLIDRTNRYPDFAGPRVTSLLQLVNSPLQGNRN